MLVGRRVCLSELSPMLRHPLQIARADWLSMRVVAKITSGRPPEPTCRPARTQVRRPPQQNAWLGGRRGGDIALARAQRRRVRLQCSKEGQATSSGRSTDSGTTVVRLGTTGLDTMQVLNSIGELMSDVAFESAAWDSFDMPVDNTSSFQDTVDRNMYKARFVASVTRRRTFSGSMSFEQLMVLDCAVGDNGPPVQQSGVVEDTSVPGSCSDLGLLTSKDMLLGYADLTREELDKQAAEALSMPIGTPVAVLRNCVVKAEARRRGLGTCLVNGCLATARSMLMDQSSPVCLLQVYRLNDPALQLYASAGFEVAKTWEDLEWLKGIESGALGPPQKVLMSVPL